MQITGRMDTFSLLCFISALPASLAWNTINTSRTFFIGDIPYYIPAEPIISVPSVKLSKEILPVTVFAINSSKTSSDILANEFSAWKAIDDVIQDGFLEAVVLQGTTKDTSLSPSVLPFFARQGTEIAFLSSLADFTENTITAESIDNYNLPFGPYVMAKDAFGEPALYEPRRLYWDQTQSFFKGVTLNKNGTFSVLSSTLDTDSSPYIGVPSRLYGLQKDKTQFPLAGVRVTVKDIYYLHGIRASAGNRHFYSTYEPRNATGTAVNRLIELGAEIIGTTKTVQFANGDRATAEWVDYHAPFSPRGDGNAEPSGSSTGAAAGVAAYDWVDVAIGSDTGGSIRGPSGVNGLFGVRPSVGAISLDQVLPLSDVLDTGGYISRDPKLFATFGRAWYAGSFQSYTAFPKKVLISSDFETVSPAASTVYNAFFTKLADFLGGTMTNYSIPAQFNMTGNSTLPVTTLLNTTYPTLIAYHQWTTVGAPFFADYAAANGGRDPHINPAVLVRWQYGQSQGAAGYATALQQREFFENWALNNFLTPNNASCSDTLFLYPQNAGNYVSREIFYPQVGSPPFGFGSSRIAVHARSVDMVVPIGQVPYNSSISHIEEQFPVTVSLVARRGCDFMLLDLLSALADAGIVQTVKTGRTSF